MGLFIGIDGGGSKTRYMAISDKGKRLADFCSSGTYYHQDGIDSVCKRLIEGIQELTVKTKGETVLGVCFGMPGYGECAYSDEQAVEEIAHRLSPYSLIVVNDAEVGWAGSLACYPGVNIVAGTGSIAYGRDELGHTARCGGWMEFFSDEGSGYWLGRKTLELFTKESDGRKPRAALHQLIRERFDITDDWEINTLMRDVYANSRERTAALQCILAEAAKMGDESALVLYDQAADELTDILWGVIQQLRFPNIPEVSYSGGLFEHDNLLARYFIPKIGAKVNLHMPILSPCEGAVLLAVEHFCPEMMGLLRDELIHSKQG